jgi:Mrp family chromosome partitioning ATPase
MQASRAGLEILRSIDRHAETGRIPRVAILSCSEGDGGTTVIREIVRAAKKAKKSFAVIDFHSGQEKYDGLELTPTSIREQLANNGQTVKLSGPGSNVLISAPAGEEQSGFQTTEIRLLSTLVSDGFDFVILDGPPLFNNALSDTIAETADQVYLVVRQDATGMAQLSVCLDKLDAVGVTPKGLIYNDRQLPIPNAVYNLFFSAARRG